MGASKSCFSGTDHDSLNDQDDLMRKRPHAMFKQRFTNGDSAVHEAARTGKLQTIQTLVDYIHQSWASLQAGSSLKDLQQEGKPVPSTPVEATIAALNLRNHKGQTPLILAARNAQIECIIYLLAKGADPCVVDRFGGRSALHYAVMCQSPEVVHAVMDNLPEYIDPERFVNIQAVTGLTPLHLAAGLGHIETLRALLYYNPDLNCLGSFGSLGYYAGIESRGTPLHVAASRGDVSVVIEVLRYYGQRSVSSSSPIDDPRLFKDDSHALPYDVALHYQRINTQCLPCNVELHYRCMDLVEMLDPSTSVRDMFGHEDLQPSRGVLRLQELAAAALKAGLLKQLEQLDQVVAAQEAVAAPSSCDADGAHGNEDKQCPICLDAAANLQLAPCKHGVCSPCMRSMCERMAGDPVACPLCRVAVGGIKRASMNA